MAEMKASTFSGITDNQKWLVCHWLALSHSVGCGCPRRQDLDPGDLRHHLADLSMLEIDPETGAAVFRIAGSRLRDIVGRDARGCRLDALAPRVSEMWRLGLDAALERRGPVGGVTHPVSEDKWHAWLRLPIEGPTGHPGLILCHDELFSHDPRTGGGQGSGSIQNGSSPIAA